MLRNMVHQYKLNGYNIVLDTCSGSVHVVDEVAYDIIAMYKEKEAEEIISELLLKYSQGMCLRFHCHFPLHPQFQLVRFALHHPWSHN